MPFPLIDAKKSDGTEDPGDDTGLALVDFRRSLPPRVAMAEAHVGHALARLRRGADPARLLHSREGRGAVSDKNIAARLLAPRLGALNPERLVATCGTQAALLVLLPHLVGRGGVLLAERLTYGALPAIARLAGVDLCGVEIDEEGLVPASLEAACRRTGARALYCNPTVHNPTTAVMSVRRRLEIAAVVRRCGLAIIEDDALGLLHPGAPPPIATVLPERTWYIMSASKCLAHGLRLAYLAAPSSASLEAALDPVARLSFWNASPLSLALIEEWMESGAAGEITAALCEENAAREHLARVFLDGFGFVSQPAAMHGWLPVPEGVPRASFVTACADTGVLVRGAELFAVDDAPLPEAVRLSLSTPPTRAAVRLGLDRLARLLADTDFHQGRHS